MLSLFAAQKHVMTNCYELFNQRWQMIEDIASPIRAIGHPRQGDQKMLNSILWISY